ncbi:MAG: tRNA (adenosine(37)-N6)-threonylcarbamoyltransferase complex dimerization subunit type 1 TsaB [Halanaerobiales bacterium]|nr:tRNA (adenosine(37)-N6)-threonylcarbamoyltransferase complex dimerization subunit type 1 TsaB [Halanaerobiales bacterium]
MLILGIDTSSDICSVGINNKGKFIGEININLKRRHSERLLPIIKRLLFEAGLKLDELNGIVVTNGPGSFTGLRIGLSTVQAFKMALDIPVYSISTLEYMAFVLSQHYKNSILVPTIDARNQRVYTAFFKDDNSKEFLKRLKEDQAINIDDMKELIKDYNQKTILFGSGIDNNNKFFNEFKDDKTKIVKNIEKYGGFNLSLLGYKYLKNGITSNFEELIPKYLKKPQARINWEKKYL